MNFAELKPSGCESCTLREQPGPVMGEGNRQDAKLVYIAQNPGKNEVMSIPMRPLVGGAGQVFNRQLTEAGIRRDETYITNQVKCLTPDNRTPTQHEINCCRRILDSELKACKADTIVLAGAVAFQQHIGSYSTISPAYRPSDNIMLRMGCVEQRHDRKYIGTIHPAFIMRMPEWKEAALDHLKKARSICGVRIPLPNVITRPTEGDIERHRSAAILNREFADDIESYQQPGETEVDYIGGDWKMDICGFSAIRYEAITLDAKQVHLWQDIFADPAITQFEHNGESDRYHLEQVCLQGNRRFDTMHALHYLRSYLAGEDKSSSNGSPGKKGVRRGPGLALKPSTISVATHLPYFNRDLEDVDRRLYNGMDCIATLLAGRWLRQQHAEWGIDQVFTDIGMKMPHILEMWRRKGVNIDLRRMLLYKMFLEQRIEYAKGLIAKMLGPAFNPGSWQQVRDLLYVQWKLPIQYNIDGKTREKKVTTDNEARKRLRKWIAGENANYYRYVSHLANGGTPAELPPVEQHQMAAIYLDLQDYLDGEETKLTFLSRVDGDGRIHPYFKSHGTSSFRLSSKPNLQNWPVYDVSQWGGARRDVVSEGTVVPTGEDIKPMGSLRSIVIPDNPEEDELVTTDFEQIELWAYAKQTNCKWLLDIYEKGEYIYGTVYEKFYKLPFFQEGKPRKKKFKVPEVSEKFLRRAKAIPLGFLYGRSAGAVAEEHGWSTTEAEGYRRQWFALCPELEQSYTRDRFTMEQKGWIRYPFGHVIHYPSRKPSDVYAMRGQNPAAGMLLSSIIKLEEAFSARRYQNTRIALSVHDSLTFNIPTIRVIEVVEEVIFPILSRAVPELDGFVFRSSCEVGKRWDWDTEDYPDWKKAYLVKETACAAELR